MRILSEEEDSQALHNAPLTASVGDTFRIFAAIELQLTAVEEIVALS